MLPILYALSVVPGQTRMCLDPWAKAFVRIGGDVHLCCYYTPVGNLATGTLSEILDSDEAKAYRQGLLTGELKPACQCCGDKRICTTQELEEKVREWYATGKMDVL